MGHFGVKKTEDVFATHSQATKSAPKRSTGNIPAEEKNKALVPEPEEEEAEARVLRKLKPKIPDHNDTHPVAEDMTPFSMPSTISHIFKKMKEICF
ncbi:hypothetical protein ACR2WS_26710 [Klebsiella pneumoniae]